MWNKFLLILFVGALTFSLSGQQYRRTRRTRDIQTTTVQQKKTEEKKSAKPAVGTPSRKSAAEKVKFDPKKPNLTQSQIDYMMNSQIRQRLLECRIYTKLPGSRDDNEAPPREDKEKPEDGEKKPEKFTFISRLDFSILMSHYQMLLSNFELIEVSRIRPEWYQRFQTELDKFAPIINEMTIALRTGSNERYADCVKKFKAHQKACLDFLKEKPPRISREQYDALVLKNSKIRQQNYLKRLKEEREAAIKRREEMLKQQTQPQKQPSKNESKP